MDGKSKILGSQSILFENPPEVLGYASVAGKKEQEGPLGTYFDMIVEDGGSSGADNWEAAESNLQKMAVEKAMCRARMTKKDIRYLLAGDLLGQLIATSFGIMDFNIPVFGLYGACSTMGESASLAAMLIDGGYAENVVALTSSHYASAEKQFRFPLGYGSQRPLSASWTVTGSAALVIGKSGNKAADGEPSIKIKGITTGKIIDYGIKDSMNMGAAMAPAAADLIAAHLEEFGRKPEYYDRIITGDLGYIGGDILNDLMKEKGQDIKAVHMDCGMEIFDRNEQDTHAGGSGCACSGITLAGYVFRKMKEREWKRILFVPTGALLSTVSFNEGQSVPGIAHGVVFEAE